MQNVGQIQNNNISVTSNLFFDIFCILALGGFWRWEPHGRAIITEAMKFRETVTQTLENHPWNVSSNYYQITKQCEIRSWKVRNKDGQQREHVCQIDSTNTYRASKKRPNKSQTQKLTICFFQSLPAAPLYSPGGGGRTPHPGPRYHLHKATNLQLRTRYFSAFRQPSTHPSTHPCSCCVYIMFMFLISF